MIARRALVGGGLAAVCAGGAARAQWPAPPGGRRPPPAETRQIDPAPPGGLVSPEEARRTLSRHVATMILEDEPMDASSEEALLECGVQLGVNAAFGFYDDREGPNAFTTLAPVLGWSKGEPCILFGRRLLYQYAQGHRLGPGDRMLYAHEHAHVRQFDDRLPLTGAAIELHADYLAGWVLGRWDRRVGASTDLDAATRPFSAESRLYNDPAGHGAPAQRREAVRSGYALGQRGVRVSDAVGEGMRWVGA